MKLLALALLSGYVMASPANSQVGSVVQMMKHGAECKKSCSKPNEHCRINKVGDPIAYSCVCKPGYVYKTGSTVCVPNKCYRKCQGVKHMVCIEDATTAKLAGGIECRCDIGYKFTDASKTKCVKDDVCKNQCTGGNMICIPEPTLAAGFRCKCWSGYVWSADKTTCVRDPRCVGRCTAGKMICLVDESKKDGFRCKCWTGYNWKDDAHTQCVGDNCVGKCTGSHQLCIDDENNADNYHCDCEPGFNWNGAKTECLKPAPKKVDGGWGDWKFGAPSETCGLTKRTRSRKCDSPAPAHGGAVCEGAESETIDYDHGFDCPLKKVNGAWSSWVVGKADKTCGYASRTKTRKCNNPAPKNGGDTCNGEESETDMFDTGTECSVDGGWSEYGDWSDCSKKCGGGTKTKSRTCSKPAPKNGGADCAGEASESESCNEQACVKIPSKAECTDAKVTHRSMGVMLAPDVCASYLPLGCSYSFELFAQETLSGGYSARGGGHMGHGFNNSKRIPLRNICPKGCNTALQAKCKLRA